MDLATLTGTYQRPDGTADQGTIRIWPRVEPRIIREGGVRIFSGELAVDLEDGVLEVQIPSGQDPATSPTDYSWMIREELDSLPRGQWRTIIINPEPGEVLDLSTVEGGVAATPVVSQPLTHLEVSEILAALEAGLPGGGAGVTGQGAWLNTEDYVVGDVVSRAGGSWLCIADRAAQTGGGIITPPSGDPDHWMLLADGIADMFQHSGDHSPGTTDVYRFKTSNGSLFPFEVYNGQDGADGADGADGVDGMDGADGIDGAAGADGGPLVYAPGLWTGVPHGYAAGAGAGGSNLATPFSVTRAIHVEEIAVHQLGGADVGRTIRLGIYADAGGRPGDVLLDVLVSAEAAGSVTAACDLDLEPGIYWTHYGPSHAAILCQGIRNGTMGWTTPNVAIDFATISCLVLGGVSAAAITPTPAFTGAAEDALRLGLKVT